ncbi:cupin domain-containing protein [Virgibacillus senegalensis]|uniref:cupin domain-containing protein n=1 Tax=Virgibacillus senegalensis TaxID=1499679 RepID=UPI00069D7228|nr:cupin domain-containing protein [Virgibacillus senegalensis]
MYYNPYLNPYYYYAHGPMYSYGREYGCWSNPGGMEQVNNFYPVRASSNDGNITLKDYGRQPFVVNINEASKLNNTYRTALWTGKHLQVTLMSLKVGEDIGLEMHPNVDQFLRIEQGQGIVQMGKRKEDLNFVRNVSDDSAIMVPAGTWHNVTNTGNIPLKLYSIYAPPNHPFGTVHRTKAEAIAEEG